MNDLLRYVVALLSLTLVLPAGADPAHATTPALLTGSVVDELGRPIAGATLELLPYSDDFESALERLAGAAHGRPVARATSSSRGRYEIEVPQPGVYQLTARSPDRLPMMLQPLAVVEARELPPARLRPAVSRRARVLGADRRPLADAWLLAHYPGAPAGRSVSGWLDPDAGWRPLRRAVRTDAQGIARFPVDPERGARLSVWPADAPSFEVADRGQETVIAPSAPAARRLLQVVDETGQPVAGAVVRAGPRLWPRGVTGESGRFELVESPGELGVLLLTARSRRLVRLSAEQSSATLTLPEMPRLEGKVLSTNGADSGHALVWSLLDPGVHALVDAERVYRFAAVPAVPFGLQIEASGSAPERHRLSAEKLRSGRGPSVALEPTSNFEVRAVDPEGRPIAGAAFAAFLDPPTQRRFSSPDPADGRAWSDAEGRATVARVLPGRAYRLIASAPGYLEASLELRAPAIGGGARVIELVLHPQHGALGRVIDEHDRPISDAMITLVPHASAGAEVASVDPRFEGRSDAEGWARVPEVPAGEFDAVVSAEGFAPLTVRRVPARAAADDPGAVVQLGTFVLLPERALVGRVETRSEEPIAEASVWVFEHDLRQLPPAKLARDHGPPQATTDDEGFFRVGGLAPGAIRDLLVRAPGYQLAVVEAVTAPTEKPVVVRLEPAARVSGRVLDEAGEPIPDAAISLFVVGLLADVEREVASGVADDRTVRSDERGEFVFSDLRPGRGRLSVHAEGYVETPARVLELVAGEAIDGIELRLQRGATVRGTVMDTRGRPVDGARVTVASAGGFTDAEGRYAFSGVPKGPAQAMASHRAYRRQSREVSIESEMTTLDWTFDAGHRVAGRVVTEDRQPVPGAVVELRTGEKVDGRILRTTTTVEGGFEFEVVPQDDYRLRASADGLASRELERWLEVGREPTEDLLLTLDPGAQISGRVLGLDADELSRVRVRLESTAHGESQTTRPDWQGEYSLHGVLPGDYRLHAFLDRDRRQVETRLGIDPGTRYVERDLSFDEGLTLTGTVLVEARPLAAALVSVRGTGSALERSVRTDHEGRFRFGHLEPDTYWLGITHRPRRLAYNDSLELDGDRDLTFDLTAATLEGTVVDAETGAPVARCSVTLRGTRGLAGAEGLTAVATDAAGRFYVPRIAHGAYALKARCEGYTQLERAVTIEPGESVHRLDLEVEPSAAQMLAVSSVSGSIPTHVDVVAADPATGQTVSVHRHRLDAAGRARLGGMPSGSWRLFVSAPSQPPVELEVSLPVSPPAPIPIALPAATPVSVLVPELRNATAVTELRIYRADGSPVVMIDPTLGLRSSWPVIAGRVSPGALAPGRYVFELADGGSTVAVIAGPAPIEVRLSR